MKKMLAALAALTCLVAMPATASTSFDFTGVIDSTNTYWNFDGYDSFDYLNEYSTITAVSDSDPTLVSEGGVDTYVYDFSSITGSGKFDYVRFISAASFQLLVTPSLHQITFTFNNGWAGNAKLLTLTLPTAYVSGDYAQSAASFAGSDTITPFDGSNYYVIINMADATFSASTVVASPGVPEAATWTLFLIGFGAVGLAVRRRRVVFAAG